MTDVVIQVEHLSKRYRIGRAQQRHDTLRDLIVDLGTRMAHRLTRKTPSDTHDAPPEDFIWALKDVSFEVRRGEVLGIIGRNGAGKSTLLKILSRITEPTEGRAIVRGRVGSLLEVGTGFHPELTGRENIYLNGAILGMRKAEIDRKFDEIVAFAGIERFLDTPVKRYSSGMYVRLAFAVAAHLEPEILLVDEVLAVGDAAFQKKCLGKMGQVAGEGRTVLFVSHNMAAVQHLCRRVVRLDKGAVRDIGDPESVITLYLETYCADTGLPVGLRYDREGNGKIRITDLVINNQNRGHAVARTGDKVSFELFYEAFDAAGLPVFYIGINDLLGVPILHMNTRMTGADMRGIKGCGCVICSVPRIPLPPGRYRVNVTVSVDGDVADRIENAAVLEVAEGDYFGTGETFGINWGKCLVDHIWTHRRVSC